MDVRVELDHCELFIDGKRVEPISGEYSIDLDPATEEPIAEVAQGGKADVDPIQISDKIADDQKWHEPHRNLGDRTSFDLIHLMFPNSTFSAATCLVAG